MNIMFQLKQLRIRGLYEPDELQKQCQEMGVLMNMDPCHMEDDESASDCSDVLGAAEVHIFDCVNNDLTEDEYEVEKILDCAKDQGQMWYLVKWKDWEETFNTWEPEKNLIHSRAIILEYISKMKNSHQKIDDSQRRLVQVDHRKKIREFTKLVLKDDDVATMLKFCGMTYIEFVESGKTPKQLNKDLRSVVDCFLSKKKISKNFASVVSRALICKNGFQSELLDYAEKRASVLQRLQKWMATINRLPGVMTPIVMENDIDLEGPPENFTYITDYKAGEGIIIPDDPMVGCCCADCFKEKKSCCVAQSTEEYAYNHHGYIKVPEGTPIYECNKRCLCQDDCSNRVVQKGRKVRLAIFRTHDGRGWGVKALQKIKRGQFVMEYVGEVITSEEAENRGKIYDEEGRTYLFDLDFNEDDHPFTVDAAHLGNVAHFVNHSCDPNLNVFTVWINNLDPRLPRIAFFAKRDIRRGEELTFDYKMSVGANDATPHRVTVSPYRTSATKQQKEMPPPSTPTRAAHEDVDLSSDNSDDTETESQEINDSVNRIPCKCGAVKCRKYLY